MAIIIVLVVITTTTTTIIITMLFQSSHRSSCGGFGSSGNRRSSCRIEIVIGFMNFVTPLQLGVRDVAFPTMNSVSFWLTAAGAFLVNISLFIGEFARTGWLPYPPLSETTYSPGVGVDYIFGPSRFRASAR